MAKKKGKKVFPKVTGNASKEIVERPPENYARQRPVWRFDLLDKDGEFAFDLRREDFKHSHVLEKLIEYGNMTWAEISQQTHDIKNRTKHHFLDVNQLSPAAKRRIAAKRLEDSTDIIFSFALHNTLRIIGIRERAEFHIIWYDPNHAFCPRKT